MTLLRHDTRKLKELANKLRKAGHDLSKHIDTPSATLVSRRNCQRLGFNREAGKVSTQKTASQKGERTASRKTAGRGKGADQRLACLE